MHSICCHAEGGICSNVQARSYPMPTFMQQFTNDQEEEYVPGISPKAVG